MVLLPLLPLLLLLTTITNGKGGQLIINPFRLLLVHLIGFITSFVTGQWASIAPHMPSHCNHKQDSFMHALYKTHLPTHTLYLYPSQE